MSDMSLDIWVSFTFCRVGWSALTFPNTTIKGVGGNRVKNKSEYKKEKDGETTDRANANGSGTIAQGVVGRD